MTPGRVLAPHTVATVVRLTPAGADYHGLPVGHVGRIVGWHPPEYEVQFPGYSLPCSHAEIEPLEAAP